jgi:RHS repeat-associated protein
LISRRDFHPFGEEIITTQRTQGLGYTADSVRQKFTGYQKDNETDLDFAQARMYASKLGRFTSTDPILMNKKRLNDPQQINLYSYVRNNPLVYVDRNGRDLEKGYGYNEQLEKAIIELAKRKEGRELLQRLDNFSAKIKLGQGKGIAEGNFEKIDGSLKVVGRDENGKANDITSRDGIFINVDFDAAKQARNLKGSPGEVKGEDVPKNDTEQVLHGILHLVRQADGLEKPTMAKQGEEYEKNEKVINEEVRRILSQPEDKDLKKDAKEFVQKILEPKPKT